MDDDFMTPSEMATFLNEVASEYFKDKQDIMMKLMECSMYIFTIGSVIDKRSTRNSFT